ncbi:MAG: deoxyguanosinetriphosphate triphosphohydrolase [Bacteroidetes bacterium]|nr:deoxyguanosinetriphosphate triphosphohydrolase [Bacteroidota bacterium]
MNWTQLLSPARLGQPASLSASTRSAFEQDYDRIIFSHPFRRLQDKTQVHPLPEYDFVHTRLTHSLEVSSVGRSLGKRVGEILLQRHPELSEKYSLFDFGAIVAAAALAHDLGNPPFGHAGEDALSDFFKGQNTIKHEVSGPEWEDLIRFEGNAQGFRILNQQEYGLRLTMATLGAFTKYPCEAHFPDREKVRRSQKKYGFFQSEKDLFKEIATQLQLIETKPRAWCRHPLAFLVEAADDICYSVIDLEDGCRLGLVSFDETVDLLAPVLGTRLDRQKLSGPDGLNKKLGILRALAIGELIEACADVFLKNEDLILSGEYDKALVDETSFQNALKTIATVSVERIYRARAVTEIEAAGHVVLPGLLEEFITAGRVIRDRGKSRKFENLGLLFPLETRMAIAESESVYVMLRLIIDFVSGLTDRHALSLYRKIKGISLS